jgi:hypothetical protein
MAKGKAEQKALIARTAQIIGEVLMCQNDEQCSNRWQWQTCTDCQAAFKQAAEKAVAEIQGGK